MFLTVNRGNYLFFSEVQSGESLPHTAAERIRSAAFFKGFKAILGGFCVFFKEQLCIFMDSL